MAGLHAPVRGTVTQQKSLLTMTARFLTPRLFAQGLLVAVSVAALVLCPYSKVEESFGLQAVYDLFYHGLSPLFEKRDPLPYDHLQFPGVVPRTFLGPLVIATICQVIRWIQFLLVDISLRPELVQSLARLVLLLFNVAGFFAMARALDKKTANTTTGTYLLIITACQFHLPFYASRMLPNTFALCLTLQCYAAWLRGNCSIAAVYLVIAVILIRCDLILLLLTVGLSWLFTRQLTVLQAIKIGVATVAISLALTIPLDSALWQRWTWPEGEVLYYNTILNKSSDWGVSVWHWYWTSALPRALLLTALLIPLSFWRLPEILAAFERRGWKLRKDGRRVVLSSITWIDRTWLPYLLPALGFVALYSALGHKEVRFLFPALPLFNLAAAAGMSRLHHVAFPRKDKKASRAAQLGYLAAVSALVFSFSASCLFVAISTKNYPGGEALKLLANHVQSVKQQSSVKVHIDVASAMTGVSLFGQRAAVAVGKPGATWQFDKAGYEEDHAMDQSNLSRYTHLLSETKEVSGFEVIAMVQGNPRLDLRRSAIVITDTIYVLERKGWSNNSS
jgi:alpha-1,6-mannosyltransferase